MRRGVRPALSRAGLELLPHRVLREFLPGQIAEPERAHHVSVGRPVCSPLAGTAPEVPPR